MFDTIAAIIASKSNHTSNKKIVYKNTLKSNCAREAILVELEKTDIKLESNRFNCVKSAKKYT